MEHEYVSYDYLQGILERIESEIGHKLTKMIDIVHQFGVHQPTNYVYSCMEPLLLKATERYNYLISRGNATLHGPEGNHHSGQDIYVPPSMRYYLTTPGLDFNLDFWYPFLELYKSFLDRKFRHLTAIIQDVHNKLTDFGKNRLAAKYTVPARGISGGIAAMNKIMDFDWENPSQIPSYEVARYVVTRIFHFIGQLISRATIGQPNLQAIPDSPSYSSRHRDVRKRIDQIPEVRDYEIGLDGRSRPPRLRQTAQSRQPSPLRERRPSGDRPQTPTATASHVKQTQKTTTPPSPKNATRLSSAHVQGAMARPISASKRPTKKSEPKPSAKSTPEPTKHTFLKRKAPANEPTKTQHKTAGATAASKPSTASSKAHSAASSKSGASGSTKGHVPAPSHAKRPSPSTGAIPKASKGHVPAPSQVKGPSHSTGAIPKTSRVQVLVPSQVKGPSPSTDTIPKTMICTIPAPSQIIRPSPSTSAILTTLGGQVLAPSQVKRPSQNTGAIPTASGGHIPAPSQIKRPSQNTGAIPKPSSGKRNSTTNATKKSAPKSKAKSPDKKKAPKK